MPSTMIRLHNRRRTFSHSSSRILDAKHTLGYNGKLRHALKLIIEIPRESLSICASLQSISFAAYTVAVCGRIDGPDDCFGETGFLYGGEEELVEGVVGWVGVELGEDDLVRCCVGGEFGDGYFGVLCWDV